MAPTNTSSKAAQHTPGPWHVETWDYPNATPRRSVPTVQTATDAITQLCELWPPDEREAERDANARLIAAAPELLQTLRDLVEAVKCMDYGSLDDTAERNAKMLLARIDGND